MLAALVRMARRARAGGVAAWAGLLLLALAASAQAAPAAPAEAKPVVVRYGVLAGFPPFQVWPDNNRAGGADVELVRDLAARAGLVLELVRYTEYARLEADLAEGRIQLASAMARTRDREARLLFTPPYVQVPLALVTRAEQPSASLLPDLAGRSIAVVQGYASGEQVDRLFPLASRVVVQSLREGLEAVRSGRADTLLEMQPALADLIAREQMRGLSIVRRVDAPSGRLHLAVPRSQEALAARLGEALLQVPVGRADSLVAAWSAPTPVQRPDQVEISELERQALQAWTPVIGIVGQDPPFASRGARGEAEGLAVDLLRATLQRLGVQPGAVVHLGAAELQQKLLEGRLDIVVGADEAADRTPLLRFVGPFIEYPTVLIGRPESGAFDLEQLDGRRLALTPNSPARPLVDSRHPAVRVVPCNDTLDCVDAVRDGRADATLADVVGAATTLARAPRPELQMIGSEPRLRRFHSFALADRHAAVVPVFKRALDVAMTQDLPALKTQWFSRPGQRDVLVALAQRFGPAVAAVLLLLSALWLLHSRRLHAEVRRTRAAQAEAEARGAATQRFTTFLAHEVRNSLHAVIAGTELARLPGRGGAEVNAMLADSARGTLHLLNDLIDRERLHAGRLVLHPVAAQPTPLLQAVVEEMRPAARLRNQSLALLPLQPEAAGGAGPRLLLDGLRLQQVLRNLLSNAIKYGEGGPIEVQASLLAAPGGGVATELLVEVRDRGPGIAEGQRARLFEPFQARAASASSAGLGLPLCQDLARLMGGAVTLQPRLGGGTVASLRIPAHAAEPPADQLGDQLGDQLDVGRSPLQLLVIEPAGVYGLLLVRALESRGLRAQSCATLAGARHALQTQHFDLVLAEPRLPDGGASQLLQALADGAGPARPRLVLMSADPDSVQPVLLHALQGRPVLEKTNDVRALVDQVLRSTPARPAAAPA